MPAVEGWARVLNARRQHFFRNKTSLCGSWVILFELIPDNYHQNPVEGYIKPCKKCAFLRRMELERENAKK